MQHCFSPHLDTLQDAVRPQPVRGGSETILVVGDELATNPAVKALASIGYRVLHAADACAALGMLDPALRADLLLARVDASDGPGADRLVKRARQALPTIAVLLTSAACAGDASDELAAGAELLAEPYSRDELALRVRHALGNQQQVNALTKVLRQAGAAPTATRTAHWRVLLVEDQEDVRETSQQLLELFGCDVQAVPDAESAEVALQRARFDVLLTDITLPGRSGLDLARGAERRQPALRIVVSSGYDRAASTVAGVRTWTLTKPYGAPELEALFGELART
jgi:DNA-binding NtrC family response regulator